MGTTATELNKGLKIPADNGAARNGKLANPRSRRMILGIVIVVIAAVSLRLYFYYRDRVTTDDAQVDGHITQISSKIYGNVVEVLVEDNQQVKAGQILLRIDLRDYQVKVDQARAALALTEGHSHAAQVGVPLTQETTQSGTSAAEAQLSAAEADYQQAKVAEEKAATSELAYARANVEARQAACERAQADLARMRPLMEKAEISQQQFDAFQAAARVAESELKASQEKVATARQEVETAHAKTLAAAAKVNQARAALAQSIASQKQVTIRTAEASSAVAAVSQARANQAAAELQLSYTAIIAPIDGIVTKKAVEVGQVVQPGQGLMVLIPLHDVWITANFKETQLDKVKPGQKAEIEVDMYGKTFKGKVDSVAGATGARLSLLPPENATGNYVKVVQRIPVKIVLDRGVLEEAVLRPGMNVVATIFTK